MAEKLNHFDQHGNAVMVDVTDKNVTEREAIATGKIFVCDETYERIINGNMAKGDVLAVARVAGIMATKKTSELIPMCHPLMLTKAKVDFEFNEEEKSISATCLVKLSGKTGVEMEALTGVNVALLTIYDMSATPAKKTSLVWPVPRSLAATYGIEFLSLPPGT